MRKQIRYSMICICLSPLLSFAQDSTRSELYIRKYFPQPNENTQNHLFTAGYHYMLNPIGNTLGAQGTIANLGINLARFFSDKIIIGLVGDFKFIPGISTKKIPEQFTSDFNAYFIPTYSSELDSANAYLIRKAFSSDNYLFGNNQFNFGGMLSIFPQKFGGIMLQVKYGSTGFEIHGVSGNKFVNNGGNDKVPMGVTGNWVYELTFKPMAFARNTYMSQMVNGKPLNFGNSFVLSFFYERLNFKTAEFNGSNVSDMVGGDFMEKYGIDNRFGFKIGIAFY